tara:strand:- start:301 stop:609 length:309 start_codon:yes stop_codon:yes gene_type:complete
MELYVHSSLYEKKIEELEEIKQDLEITKKNLLLTIKQKKETYNLLTEARILLTRLEGKTINNLYSSISDMKNKNKLSFDLFFKQFVDYKTKWKGKKYNDRRI